MDVYIYIYQSKLVCFKYIHHIARQLYLNKAVQKSTMGFCKPVNMVCLRKCG